MHLSLGNHRDVELGEAMETRMCLKLLTLAITVAAVGCAAPHLAPRGHNLPPAQRLMEPGPGVGGPGPGVLAPQMGLGAPMAPRQSVQVVFSQPESMEVRWSVTPGGGFDSQPLVTPGRTNFPQGAIYGLKLTNIEKRIGVELYPTLEVALTTPRTAAYLAHNAIPIQFTPEDFDQVLAGNFVTKVIYLPDPEFQELALSGVETLVSTRLDPGVDPIAEADHRGSIMAILRMGNIDKEMPGTFNGGAAIGPDGQIIPVAYAGGAGPVVGAPGMMPAGMMGPGGYAPGGYVPGGPVPMNGPSSTGNFGGGMNHYVSGVSGPEYGMPMSGTPIGLPGPAHIPHGIPAGLQRHSIHNHTRHQIPPPTQHLDMHVQQTPGLSYPPPADTMLVREKTVGPGWAQGQPSSDWRHVRTGPGVYGGQYGGVEGGGQFDGGVVHGENCNCPSCQPQQ